VRFDWDEGNLRHIARHGVTAAEVEQAFEGKLQWDPPYVRNDEVRASVLGRTPAQRVLQMVVTTRGTKLRVVTAHTAKKKERERYAEYEKSQASQASAALERG
jgi:uncharacterized DUF497 family protein